MTEPEAMRAMIHHRISLDAGVRIRDGQEQPIWIARKRGWSASDEDACEAVRKVVDEMGRVLR
jgi:hypothetical protein